MCPFAHGHHLPWRYYLPRAGTEVRSGEGSGAKPRLVLVVKDKRVTPGQGVLDASTRRDGPRGRVIAEQLCRSRQWLERRILELGLATPEELRTAPWPKSVMACELGVWHLELVDRKTGEVKRTPFKCKSWRHFGTCRNSNMLEKRERIAKALIEYDFADVAFLVLTLDPKRRFAKRDGRVVDLGNPYEAFKELGALWRSFAKFIKRNWGYAGFVSTVEQHASGMPHLNVLLVSRRLSEALNTGGSTWRVIDELKGAAVRCHFGPKLTAEAARKPLDLARYIAKVAVELDERVNRNRLVNEIEKGTQTIMGAPPRTRNLRSSKGFLPATPKQEKYTGRMVMRPVPTPKSKLEARRRWFQMELELPAANERPPEQLLLWA